MSISISTAPMHSHNGSAGWRPYDTTASALMSSDSISLINLLTNSNTTDSNITSDQTLQTLQYLQTIGSNLSSELASDLEDMGSDMKKRTFAEIFLVSLALVCLILATIIGNIFVISAIILEKNLKSVGNYLVLSLAVTDLMVACLVMPLGAFYEITQEWTFGSSLCELWTCTDVLCCTASILHLLAIACDRFWAVTNVDYVHQRNGRHIGGMIAVVWVVSAVISLAPILGWKDSDFERRINEEKRCLVSQDVSYQIFATMFSFYGPSALVLILYYRIYLVAKKRIRRKSSGGVRAKGHKRLGCAAQAHHQSVPNTYISGTEMTTMTYNISSMGRHQYLIGVSASVVRTRITPITRRYVISHCCHLCARDVCVGHRLVVRLCGTAEPFVPFGPHSTRRLASDPLLGHQIDAIETSCETRHRFSSFIRRSKSESFHPSIGANEMTADTTQTTAIIPPMWRPFLWCT
ncbi:unnamed protein product [Medioppia subpectinata]|uniref:G-protein coupled receptors family 1 profile domain-containing protein n=1 Tax=Medioppia subpectinata TaxID=1979941 RepID=A0A7R9Q6S2_9ACAR|nr:unnamed protein product [Medioppia subpectinata]CAG2114023.1 unnamed protein product [Medioppia subpectinata]